ncbi:MAG: T9SS type A sorting domain-containing protein [Saprospiraceae bacterium]|nr:T9SS type A sorting domain-containing protein [Saprospiraceae bacterium]
MEDGCGNIAANCQLFEIKDCKAPTPYCHVGIITTVMPVNGCITIWAKDLDAGSFDNCTAAQDLRIYFDDFNSDSMTICCDDFVNNRVNDELIIPVTICVEDEEGNRDCCETTVVIQDPHNVCPDVGSFGKITGEIRTLSSEETQDAEVQLFESTIMKKHMTTSTNGRYLFGDLDYGLSKEYVVKPNRNDDHSNGVSTADIVKIQRHILGIEELNTPYKIIAADVNLSNSVTASDISEIRKLILGVSNVFSKCESWTFVPSSYVFVDPKVPYNAPRQSVVPLQTPTEVIENFLAVKMGDVNNSARGRNFSGSTTRSNALQLTIDDANTVAGELYRVAFRASNFNNISAYQFTLKFDRSVLQFESLESGVLALDEANFGTNRIQDGILTTSWNSKNPMTVTSDEILFTLVFRAQATAKASSLLAINSDITEAEAYDGSLHIKDVKLGVRTEKGLEGTAVFELSQNTPNPFLKETLIKFTLPEAGMAKLSIYDVSGKVLRVYELQSNKGENKFILNKSDINVSGVLYYQLDATSHTATRRMLITE